MRVGVHRKLIARVNFPPLRVLVARTAAGRATLPLSIRREAPVIVSAAKASDNFQLWECLRSEPCGEPCHLPSSAGNTVTMELATVNDENPCGDRGLDAVCPPVALDGTDGEKWRRRESNPRVHSRNSLIAQRLWDMLQDVGVSWEWNDDANRQPMALAHEELAEVITAWPLISADLRRAILAIVHSADVMAESSYAATD